MHPDPKVLLNPKAEVVEFMYNGQVYVFQPGERRNLDGVVADHALRFVNTGLKDVTTEYVSTAKTPLPEPILIEKLPTTKDDMDSETNFELMKWKDLVSLGSKYLVFKPGMSREALITELKILANR